MAKSTRKKQLWSVATLEAFPYGSNGIACLVVQTSPDGDSRFSEINACDDFDTEDLEARLTLKQWIYSLWVAPDGDVYLAHSGKVIRKGPLPSPEVVLTHGHDVTRLCGAPRGVYLIGLGGYVGHLDGSQLLDMPVPDSDVFHVAETEKGVLFAAGSRGRIFRRQDDAWAPVQVAPSGDIRHLAVDGDRVLFAGSDGVCGSLLAEGESVVRFKAPADREFHAIATYRGRVYVGAGRNGVEVVEDGTVVAHKANVPAYFLCSNDSYLIASGLSFVARHDGTAWLATEFSATTS